MKKVFFTLVNFFLCVVIFAQSDYSISAAFVGHGIGTYNDGSHHYQQLDSILVVNHTKGWRGTMFFPDTVLVGLYPGNNIEINSIGEVLSQNIPNPFYGKTEVELNIIENNRVSLRVCDMTGKLYAQYEDWLPAGIYRFSINLIKDQAYLLSAMVGNKVYSIKMINYGNGGSNNICNLGSLSPKLTIENYVDDALSLADSMSYVGYTTYNSEVYVSRRLDKAWRNGTDTLYFDIPYCDDKTIVLDIQDCVPFSYNGQTYSESGHYVLEELQTACGADSIVELDLRIGGQIETEFHIETNDGEYQWGDTLLRDSGIYRRHFTSIHGCDSIVTLYLTLYMDMRQYTIRYSGIGISTLDGIERQYQQLDSILIAKESGGQWMMYYPDTTLTIINYTKLTIVNEGVYHPLTWDDRVHITGYTTYNGVVYEGGIWEGWLDYWYYLNRMDSLLYFDIPYCSDRIIIYDVQDCEPYTYNGQTYTESGHYVLEELESVYGCDSIIELDLVIRDYIFNEMEIYTCDDSYQLEDTIVTENGVFQRYYTSAHGCDSIVSYIVSLGNGFTDERDGNSYCTVQIGEQVWMAENLRYLPSVSSISSIMSYDFDVEAYFVYGYEGSDVDEAKMTDNYSRYGVLYSAWASFTACPAGWHLPSGDEWTQLEVYLENNGYNFDGYVDNDEDRETHNVIAKSLSYTSGWSISNEVNTVGWIQMKNNSSHFGAKPGGWANYRNGDFTGINDIGSWWSGEIYVETHSGDDETEYMELRQIKYDSMSTKKTYGGIQNTAASIRCVRND